MFRIAGALILIVLLQGQAAAGERFSVMELFTSQGCSSCPPADELLAEFAERDDVLALSLPIDYWDYIGWKDTLASPAFSARQRAYAKARGDREVYTPQVVVNGADHRVGSDRQALLDALGKTSDESPVSVEASAGETKARVTVGSGSAAAKAIVLLIVFDPEATVKIGRGENAGQTITYRNVVKKIVRLGEWRGTAKTYSFTLPPEGLRCAVLVQLGTEEKLGRVLGAARL
ncbi:DUF1223 domain-containing protein [Lutibaculum baratangense]|uniref:DUF1223 domain-containing protein n=1 Tax=Lutibaculum baratangense AMV1 TaxID=631454 RepID=V4RKY5_9HYPH|nr:DUF1223 domain-containing protein [Lutibaculum baratangense]ESR25959.1 hypothetical protein N177_1294 [Lutibaculum baratangense AMV1]